MEVIPLLKAYLKRLRLPAMARELEKCLKESAERNLPYERFLLVLAEQEVLQREENATRLRLRQARFPILKTLENFDFSSTPSLDKQRILQFSQGEYLSRKENMILVGNAGTGKTHIAISLGISACRQGKKVLFCTASGLINAFLEARENLTISKLQKKLLKADLVICDELGYIPFSKEGAQMLFGFFSDRYERGSVMVTTNLDFGSWQEIFGDERLTGALLDRLTHRCHILQFQGESYRFKESQKRLKKKGEGGK